MKFSVISSQLSARACTIEGRASPRPVQISGPHCASARLCRPVLRKACGFPADAAPFVCLLAGWKAEPSSLRGRGYWKRPPFGMAKPFRKSGGGAAYGR
jgi:hypothetical protein